MKKWLFICIKQPLVPDHSRPGFAMFKFCYYDSVTADAPSTLPVHWHLAATMTARLRYLAPQSESDSMRPT